VEAFYKHVEPETGRRYRLGDLTAPGSASPSKGNPHYEFLGITRYWRYSQGNMQKLYEEGRVVQTKPGAVPAYKRYLDEGKGVPLGSVWDDIGPVQGISREHVGFPTQKPLKLLERIIELSSEPNDIVLDAFCGCGKNALGLGATREVEVVIGDFIVHGEVATRALVRKSFEFVKLIEPEVFVASFSAAKDQLSQWRAYSYGTAGVSLEFDLRGFRPKGGTGFAACFAPCILSSRGEEAARQSFVGGPRKIIASSPQQRSSR
jgi:hypothetical protein